MWLPGIYFGCAGPVVSARRSACERGAEGAACAWWGAYRCRGDKAPRAPGGVTQPGGSSQSHRHASALPGPYLAPAVTAAPCCGFWGPRGAQGSAAPSKMCPVPRSCLAPGQEFGTPGHAFGIARVLGEPRCGDSVPEPSPSVAARGMELSVCSTAVPYRQPLTMFVRPLRPLAAGPWLPQDKVRSGGGGARRWLSTYRERGSRRLPAKPEHVPTSRPAPGDGGQRRHGGDPAASDPDQVSALRGVRLPSSRSSGRRRLRRVCVLQEPENRKIEGLVSGFLVGFQFNAPLHIYKKQRGRRVLFWLRQFRRTKPSH